MKTTKERIAKRKEFQAIMEASPERAEYISSRKAYMKAKQAYFALREAHRKTPEQDGENW
jgi:hypothetical protein